MTISTIKPASRVQTAILAMIASFALFLLPGRAYAQQTVASVRALGCVQNQHCDPKLLYVNGYQLKQLPDAHASLHQNDVLSSGDNQLATLYFTSGRKHWFDLKGQTTVHVTPSLAPRYRLQRESKAQVDTSPPGQAVTVAQQQDFLYVDYGEVDENVDPGSMGLILTANADVTPAAGTEFDVKVGAASGYPAVTTATVGKIPVETIVTVVNGSAAVKSPGAPDSQAVTVGSDQQVTVSSQGVGAVTDVDAHQITGWIGGLPPTISTAVLPDGQTGVFYSEQLTARGGQVQNGQGQYTWQQTGGRLPAGLALAADGTLSGEPTRAGRYSFSVQVTDAAGDTDSATYTLAITTPHTCSTSDGSQCAVVWMDRAQYRYGETPGLCYAVSEAGHVHIAITKPDGSTVTALDANDDGTGACFSLYVPVGLPAGVRQVHLDLSVDGSVVAGSDTTYRVVPPACGTTRGQHCTAIWTDRSVYQAEQTAQICYSVPQPIAFQITDITADGQRHVMGPYRDDGTGGCFTATVTPPTGTERLQLDVIANNRVYESASTTFQVTPAG